MKTPENPRIAEWTDGEVTLTADVIATGKTYADVKWRESGRVQRVRYRDPKGITLKP